MLIQLVPVVMTSKRFLTSSKEEKPVAGPPSPPVVPPPSPCLMKHDRGALSLSLYYTLHSATQKFNITYDLWRGSLSPDPSCVCICLGVCLLRPQQILIRLALSKQTRCLSKDRHFLYSSLYRKHHPTPPRLLPKGV